MPTYEIPVDTTTKTISSACPKCGTIKKSGESSCCGGGGSWFRNCGGVGNTRLQHTWYEGIRACKAGTQSRAAAGQWDNAAQQEVVDSSHDAGKVNSKRVATVAKPSAFSPANMSTLVAGTAPVIPIASTSATNSKVIAGVAITITSVLGTM